MTEIIRLNHHSFLVKTNNSYTKYNSLLHDSIRHLEFISHIQNHQFQICRMKSVQTVREWMDTHKYMSYELVIKMMLCIHQQQEKLLEKHYSFYTLNIDNILIISHTTEDDVSFICVNSKHICPLYKDTLNFSLTTTFSKDDFCSPELLQCSKLPNYSISYVSFYYTLASLVYYCFFGENISPKTIDRQFNSILYTPLYWFFQKGLQREVISRKCFFLS